MAESESIERLSITIPDGISSKPEGVFMLDGCPDPLFLYVDSAGLFDRIRGHKGKIVLCSVTTGKRVYAMSWPDKQRDCWECHGKFLLFWNSHASRGLMISYANGSFTSDEISIPKNTIHVIMTGGLTYFVCSRPSTIVILSKGSSIPVLTLAENGPQHVSSLGQLLLVIHKNSDKNLLKIYVHKAEGVFDFVCELGLPFFSYDVDRITSFGDRYYIVVGKSALEPNVAIVDCISMEIATFSFKIDIAPKSCAARVCGNLLELYVSTSHSRYYYKATILLDSNSFFMTTTEQELSSLENIVVSIQSKYEQEPATFSTESSISSKVEQKYSESNEQELSDSLAVKPGMSHESSMEQKTYHFSDAKDIMLVSENDQRKAEIEQQKAELKAKMDLLEEELSNVSTLMQAELNIHGQQPASSSNESSLNSNSKQKMSTSTKQEQEPSDSSLVVPDVSGESSTEPTEREYESIEDEEDEYHDPLLDSLISYYGLNKKQPQR